MSWPPSRILVATDFSPSARAALEVTADLGRRSGAEIDVVHAVRDPGQLITGYEVIDELLLGRADPRKLRNEARDRLEAWRQAGVTRLVHGLGRYADAGPVLGAIEGLARLG